MRFRATVVTAPEFELPEYKSIPVQLPDTKVTEAEVEAAVERLRDQSADFADVPGRGLEMEDFAVIDFEGTIDGKPISGARAGGEQEPARREEILAAPRAGEFSAAVCEQLVGQKPDDIRKVQVVFPADFPVAELAGKDADYEVTLNEIKQRVLPPVDDAFAAKLLPEKTLADLRHTIEHNLEHEKEHEVERAKEAQVVKFLHEHIQFDLPPSLLKTETRHALMELVHRNRERGVPDEVLKEKEKELIRRRSGLAAHRLKTNFILHRIAEHEKIQVTREEVDNGIREQAAHYNVSVEKMRKEFEETRPHEWPRRRDTAGQDP